MEACCGKMRGIPGFVPSLRPHCVSGSEPAPAFRGFNNGQIDRLLGKATWIRGASQTEGYFGE